MSLPPMLLVVGMVLLAMSVIERRGRTARARAVSALADQIDFAFSTVDSYGLVDLPFSLFLQSGRGTAKLVISGTHNGLPLQIFDYEHRAGKQRDRYTCALLTIPTGCPWLRLVHENPLTRLADQVVHADVKLEYDDFNHRFLVNSADRNFAFSLLDGQMMEWLLGAVRIDRLEIAGPWLLLANAPVDPRRWRELGEWLDAFHAHIPEVVYTTYPPRS